MPAEVDPHQRYALGGWINEVSEVMGEPQDHTEVGTQPEREHSAYFYVAGAVISFVRGLAENDYYNVTLKNGPDSEEKTYKRVLVYPHPSLKKIDILNDVGQLQMLIGPDNAILAY